MAIRIDREIEVPGMRISEHCILCFAAGSRFLKIHILIPVNTQQGFQGSLLRYYFSELTVSAEYRLYKDQENGIPAAVIVKRRILVWSNR